VSCLAGVAATPRAFNATQERIRQLVEDRTQALGAVSHDLRTPITRLRLDAGFLDDAEARDRIDANLDEMEALVEATLAYLREAEEPRPGDPGPVLRTVCDAAADDAPPAYGPAPYVPVPQHWGAAGTTTITIWFRLSRLRQACRRRPSGAGKPDNPCRET
jgi:signal transduction histidine kinase